MVWKAGETVRVSDLSLAASGAEAGRQREGVGEEGREVREVGVVGRRA
jgi:hypothetical protein